ncbi:hypothetical protein GN956_G20857 [Arapaima gigas]
MFSRPISSAISPVPAISAVNNSESTVGARWPYGFAHERRRPANRLRRKAAVVWCFAERRVQLEGIDSAL